MVKVGITEVDIAFEDKDTAKERCQNVIEQAAANGVELLVFPEMTLTGFTMMPAKVAEAYSDGHIPESVSFFMKTKALSIRTMAGRYMKTSWRWWMAVI